MNGRLKYHATKLGLDQTDLERAEAQMIDAEHMSRSDIALLIERKENAIKLLRIQQAALLAVLETKSR